jgi:hypothetical protein
LGKHIEAIGDTVYLAIGRGLSSFYWMRYDLKTHRYERLSPDLLTLNGPVCNEYGVSSRFGLVGIGNQVCRLVPAPQRPQSALRRVLTAGPRGVWATFEPAVPAAAGAGTGNDGHAAVPLPRELTRPERRPPPLDDLIAGLRPENRELEIVAAQVADLKPEAFPPAKRSQVSAALVPLLSSSRVIVYTPALKAFAVWHAPEAVDALLPLLKDKNPFVRQTALQALGICRDPRAIPEVAARLPTDTDIAVGCLVAIGPASEPALLESLHPSMPPARKRMIIDALAMIGTRNSIPPLQALLESNIDQQTAEIIRQAVEMIGKREK